METKIKNDHMEWEDRWNLMQRVFQSWVKGGRFPLAERLDSRMHLQFHLKPFRGNVRDEMNHPGWSLQRRDGK